MLLDLSLRVHRGLVCVALAERCGLEATPLDRCTVPRWRWDGFSGWCLSFRENTNEAQITFVCDARGFIPERVIAVPALGELGTLDREYGAVRLSEPDRLLTDGSRWCDARALRLCWEATP